MARVSPPLTIALDVRVTSHMSAGMTAYVRMLRAWLPQVAPDLRIVPVGRGDNFDLAEQVGLPWELARSGARLAHVPTPFVPVALPLPAVVTVHDLIDLHFPAFAKRKVGPYYRAIVGPVLRRARAVITDDEATATDLHALLGVRPERIAVIPLGVDDPPAVPDPWRRSRPYLLYVGNHRPHKNLACLAAAWAAVAAERELDLLLTGPADASLGGSQTHGEIVFLGELAPEALRSAYAGAAAYVHPAWREGFGLPLLEAMRAGAPVLAAATAVPAVLRAHVQSFAPGAPGELAALVRAVLDDPAGARRRAGAARDATAYLTWARTARLTAELYRRVAA